MVQLQLLDLMIPKECGAVPMDAATRADLIDLMARVLVAVFHEEGGRANDRGLVQFQDQTGAPGSQGDCLPSAIQSEKQVRQNKESQLLQYAVAERVRALGWKQVEIINSDLGSSAGLASARREGFERVLSSVALGEVGIVGSREVSRLSRTDKDWCRLLEVCQIFGTLIADEQQVYDLNYLDDQLVLGITLSVVELKVIRQRLLAGQESKARRGELFKRLPIGYDRDPAGKIVFHEPVVDPLTAIGISTLSQAVEMLREDLGIANSSLLAERERAERNERQLDVERQLVEDGRKRIDELQALLTQERDQARTSAPDTKGIIKEVIREIAGAAPPDDSDDDKQTLRTLESAIAALREQLESERCRSAQAEVRADRAERRIDELQVRLTALLKRRQAGSVPAVPKTEPRVPWWRRWFR